MAEFFIFPAVAAFLAQSILCRRVKKGILRQGTLIFPIVSAWAGIVTLLTSCGDCFGGLGALKAVLWFAAACCMVLGYGTAWFLYMITGRGKNRAGEKGGSV